jgi:hypothetical protein
MSSRHRHPTPPKAKYLAVRTDSDDLFWLARRWPSGSNQIHVQWLELVDKDNQTYRELDWFFYVGKRSVLDYDVKLVRKPGTTDLILPMKYAQALKEHCLANPL